MSTVAEGVETDRAGRTPLAMGCETAQGFYYSRPMSADKSRMPSRRSRRRDGAATAPSSPSDGSRLDDELRGPACCQVRGDDQRGHRLAVTHDADDPLVWLHRLEAPVATQRGDRCAEIGTTAPLEWPSCSTKGPLWSRGPAPRRCPPTLLRPESSRPDARTRSRADHPNALRPVSAARRPRSTMVVPGGITLDRRTRLKLATPAASSAASKAASDVGPLPVLARIGISKGAAWTTLVVDRLR